MTDLDKLIEVIEVGEIATYSSNPAPMYEFRRLWGEAHTHTSYLDGYKAYSGSLDAAEKLHKELIPEYLYTISKTKGQAIVYCGTDLWSMHSITARAWLIAILKAYRSQVQG